MKKHTNSSYNMPDAPVGRRLTAAQLSKKLKAINADIVKSKPLPKKMTTRKKAVA